MPKFVLSRGAARGATSTPASGFQFFNLTARMTNSEQPQVMHHKILLLQTVLILRKVWIRMIVCSLTRHKAAPRRRLPGAKTETPRRRGRDKCMRIAQGSDRAQDAEALLSARGARREARLRAPARLGQPCRGRRSWFTPRRCGAVQRRRHRRCRAGRRDP